MMAFSNPSKGGGLYIRIDERRRKRSLNRTMHSSRFPGRTAIYPTRESRNRDESEKSIPTVLRFSENLSYFNHVRISQERLRSTGG